MKTYQWGVVGLGGMARNFVMDFDKRDGEITAVCSRNLVKAELFADEYKIANAYGDYQAMLQNDTLDVIYIAVPNLQHAEFIMAALAAGKHVLCEKAITMTKAELVAAMELAEQKHLVLAEAMTIFNMPLYQKLTAVIDSGKLGKLKMIQAPFGSYKEPVASNRFFNPALGGGALFDIGTYAISFARYFMSATPHVVATSMVPFETGVDEQSVTILQNDKAELASVTLTFQAKMPKVGIVAFEHGYITVAEYPRADRAEIFYTDGSHETIVAGNEGEAIHYEVANFTAMINGELPNRSLYLTHDVISILDDMHRRWAN